MDIKKVRSFVAGKIVNTPRISLGAVNGKIPPSPGLSLNLAAYVSKDVGEKEYVMTLTSRNEASLRRNNPLWGFSKKLNSLYTYFPATSASSLANFIPVVGQEEEIEVRILRWGSGAQFSPTDLIDDLFLVRANRGFEIFESVLQP